MRTDTRPSLAKSPIVNMSPSLRPHTVSRSSAGPAAARGGVDDLGEVHRAAAQLRVLDLGAAGEAVGDDDGTGVGVPYRRQQPLLGAGQRHLAVARRHAEV